MTRTRSQREDEPGRLLARPKGPAPGENRPGLRPLGLETGRDGLLYVPAGYMAERPAALALMLHGAGGNAQHGLAPLFDAADAAG
jgi:phospholipase/carboxylesterase